jgi:hypothetical protein
MKAAFSAIVALHSDPRDQLGQTRVGVALHSNNQSAISGLQQMLSVSVLAMH